MSLTTAKALEPPEFTVLLSDPARVAAVPRVPGVNWTTAKRLPRYRTD
jgi:hypothetical protein